MNTDQYKKLWETANELAKKEAEELGIVEEEWIDNRRMIHIKLMIQSDK